ncbi:MAG: hypothetical protein WB775_14805, partial [Burkholderiaceae bacterium]
MAAAKKEASTEMRRLGAPAPKQSFFGAGLARMPSSGDFFARGPIPGEVQATGTVLAKPAAAVRVRTANAANPATTLFLWRIMMN